MTFMRLFIVLWLALAPVWAQPMLPIGIGKGSTTTYQGPGDIVSGASVWGSCARAYNAAYAVGGTSPACDIVDTATGLSTCTIPIGTNGFVNLTVAVCPTSSPAVGVTTFCTVTHTGCSITKVYDQTGNGHHLTQATLANMPTLTLSALNGLPSMTFTSAGNLRVASATFSVASPYSMSIVFNRTGSLTTQSYFIGDNSTAVGMGAFSSANTSFAEFATATTQTANDNAWHGLQGVGSATVGAINTDGTDSGNVNTGSNGVANGIRFGRSGAGVNVDGQMMEGGLWPSGFNSTQRGNIFTNQNSSSGYNGAL